MATSELNNHQAHGHGAADSLTLLVISALAALAVAHTGTLCALGKARVFEVEPCAVRGGIATKMNVPF